MSGHIFWGGKAVPYTAGETLAQALNSNGVLSFGTGPSGQTYAVCCGIGQCQNCLVIIDGMGPREACLTLCREGLVANPVGAAHG